MGDGAGGFSARRDFATESQLGSVIAADMNGDGMLDIVGADYGGRQVSVLINTIPVIALATNSVTNAEGNSGTTAFDFLVTASAISSSQTVQYAVTGSGANPASSSDFVGGVLPSGTVTFAPGETSKVVHIDVIGDSIDEPNESFTVTLSNASSGTISNATATGNITNDDAPPAPYYYIMAASASKAEGNSGATPFTFTVSRGGDTRGAANVRYGVSGGSLVGGLNANDFVGGVLPSGTVSFAAGETSQTITIYVQGDRSVENNEPFYVYLSAPSIGTASGQPGYGFINNDDRIYFGAPYSAVQAYGPSAGGWSSDNTFHRELADVNGDGRADIVGFGNAGMYVSMANADGTFAPSALKLAEFGTQAQAGGWSSQDAFPRHMAM